MTYRVRNLESLNERWCTKFFQRHEISMNAELLILKENACVELRICVFSCLRSDFLKIHTFGGGAVVS